MHSNELPTFTSTDAANGHLIRIRDPFAETLPNKLLGLFAILLEQQYTFQLCIVVNYDKHLIFTMMTSSNGNNFRVTGHLCGGFTGPRWIPPHKGQWRGALMFSLICVWINGWVNNGGAGDLRRNRTHYDVSEMTTLYIKLTLNTIPHGKACQSQFKIHTTADARLYIGVAKYKIHMKIREIYISSRSIIPQKPSPSSHMWAR